MQRWLAAVRNGGWKKFAPKFAGLHGVDLASLHKEDFLRRVPSIGDAIHAAWQRVLATGT